MYANTSDETTAQCTFTRDMFFPPSHRTADAVSLHVVVLGWPLANDNLHNLFVCNGYAKRTYRQQQQQRDSPYSHGLLCGELTRHRNHLSRSGCRRSRCIRNLSAPKPTQYVRRWVDERWCEWWYQYYGPNPRSFCCGMTLANSGVVRHGVASRGRTALSHRTFLCSLVTSTFSLSGL